MSAIAWVALGGALGSVTRYLIALRFPNVPGGWPVATIIVNVAGSFAIGVLSAVFAARAIASGAAGLADTTRLFWLPGVLGGFTTYSAFALETVLLAEGGDALRAAAYVTLTVVGCLVAAYAGRLFAQAMI